MHTHGWVAAVDTLLHMRHAALTLPLCHPLLTWCQRAQCESMVVMVSVFQLLGVKACAVQAAGCMPRRLGTHVRAGFVGILSHVRAVHVCFVCS